MKITKNMRKRTMRIKIEDSDNYDVTDDNGVVFYPTKKQAQQIARAAYSLNNTVLIFDVKEKAP